MAGCPECGAEVVDRAACQALFDDVLAREFGDYRYGRIHRLTVDAYSLQHPDEYMRSAKSYAAHLTGAYAALEIGAAHETNRVVQQWLSAPQSLTRPGQPAPRRRGVLTIAHVHAAVDAEDHLKRVRELAASAWEAWHEFHGQAAEWIRAATASASRTPDPSPTPRV